ncbi:MAG: M48 family metalloprotease, partial [Hyphomicrobiales bacterium]|nr:M48 family metalloprotease [Hyphomicrobiales bacterium]
IGAREHPKIVAAYGGPYHDAAAERQIEKIVGRLVAASDAPETSYRITILNSPAVNAFALPGGYLYITRGLLALANDASEVAAVLAHEIAHVTARHAIERENRVQAAVVASRVVKDVFKDTERARATLVSSQVDLASFSRAQELEADEMGVRTIAKAGYDPHAAARFLQSMGRFADLTSSEGNADFLSSHPGTSERIKQVIAHARRFGAPGVGRTDRDAYLGSINGLQYGDDPSGGVIRGTRFMHPGLAITFEAPSGYRLQNTAKAVLGTADDDAALRFDSVDIPAGQSLIDYLASGWINGLDTETISAITVSGFDGATAVAEADGWSFRVSVVRIDGRAYRFIFATRELTPGFDAAAQRTVASFRKLSATEVSKIRPQRIRIVTVRQGDTAKTMAARMGGGRDGLALFLVLNGLTTGDRLEPGTRVKIIGN